MRALRLAGLAVLLVLAAVGAGDLSGYAADWWQRRRRGGSDGC